MKRIIATAVPFAFLMLAALPAQAAETKDTPGMAKDAGKSAAGQVHKGQGTVNRVDDKVGKINVAHGPIPGLNWPAMTMDFQVNDKALLKGVTPGQNIEFDIAQQGPGQFVITRIAPNMQQPVRGAPAGADAHMGHH